MLTLDQLEKIVAKAKARGLPGAAVVSVKAIADHKAGDEIGISTQFGLELGALEENVADDSETTSKTASLTLEEQA